jgi:hypothetical protein
LLANIYMNRFLKHWRASGRGEAFRAYIVNYADDFVILSRGRAAEALAWTKAVMTKLGLTLNEAKSSLKDARRESFSLLGYTVGPQRFRKDGHWCLGASPLEEKRSADQDKDRRPAHVEQQGPVARASPRSSTGSWPSGRRTSATARVCWRTRPLTTTSTNAFATSSRDGTSSKDAARTWFLVRRFTANWVCCISDACILDLRREPCDEAGRKAGCGKSARPV